MKKIILITLIMLLMVNVGFAKEANWEYISGNEYVDIYLDTNSVKPSTLDAFDILKCRVKILYNDNSYENNLVFVNIDTKGWAIIQENRYNKNDTLINSKEYIPQRAIWETYREGIWQPFVDKVISIGNTKED